MSLNNSSSEKITAPLFSALYNFEPRETQKLLSEIIHPSAFCHYFHPIGDVEASLIYERIYAPLFIPFQILRDEKQFVFLAKMLMENIG